MRSYVPNTSEERQAMLEAIGLSKMEELFIDIPIEARLKRELSLDKGKSELEIRRHIQSLVGNAGDLPLFRGAGAYRHYIPAVVKAITSRSEFYTSYTPYQAEMSQGMLQSIFEYQTLMCELTGFDASNASVYDGGTACAEAMVMLRSATRKTKVLCSSGLHPEYLEILRTYARFTGFSLVELPLTKEGVTDIKALEENAEGAAGVIIQSPNFFGCIENFKSAADLIHAKNGLLVAAVNPISLGLLVRPGDAGADICVGEGQPLGLALSAGGPYLGIMTAKQKLMRSLPGRIVGQTEDSEGNRAFVLTLQGREQHIRREKAASNICSNQSLCALSAAVYLSAMGPKGLKEVAEQCLQKAHYLKEGILAIPKMRSRFEAPFFHEFVIESEISSAKLNKGLRKRGFIGGLPLSRYYKGDEGILYCATEANSRNELDEFLNALEVCAK